MFKKYILKNKVTGFYTNILWSSAFSSHFVIMQIRRFKDTTSWENGEQVLGTSN